MARPRPLGGPSAGPSAYKLNDPRSDKPSWFSLEVILKRKEGVKEELEAPL